MIKDTITIEGDVRALTDDTRDNIQNEMTRLVRGLEEMFGVICDFEFKGLSSSFTMILNLLLM